MIRTLFLVTLSLLIGCGGSPKKPDTTSGPWPMGDSCKARDEITATPLTAQEHAANIARAAQEANVFPGIGANGIKLGMTVEEALAAVDASPSNKGDGLITYDNMLVFLRDGKVTGVWATETTGNGELRNKDLLPSGLAPGASREQVRAVLGEPEGRSDFAMLYPSKGLSVQFHGLGASGFSIHSAKPPLAFPIEPGVGVGPVTLGKDCKQLIEELGPYSSELLLAADRPEYSYGQLSFICSADKVFVINLFPDFQGVTPEGLGFANTTEEFRKAGHQTSRARRWFEDPGPGLVTKSGLWVKESCVEGRPFLMQVTPKSP